MATKRSPLFWLRWIVLVAALAWFWIAPRRLWSRFLAALDHGSVPELQGTVDQLKLQDNFRTDLATAMKNEPGDHPDSIRAHASMGFLTGLVEAAASPAGIQEAVAGFGYTGPASMTGPMAPEISFHYRSPITMEVWMHAPGTPDSQTGIFTLQLSGSGWHVTRIRGRWLDQAQP